MGSRGGLGWHLGKMRRSFTSLSLLRYFSTYTCLHPNSFLAKARRRIVPCSGAGIWTPINAFRAHCPTVKRPPSIWWKFVLKIFHPMPFLKIFLFFPLLSWPETTLYKLHDGLAPAVRPLADWSAGPFRDSDGTSFGIASFPTLTSGFSLSWNKSCRAQKWLLAFQQFYNSWNCFLYRSFAMI